MVSVNKGEWDRSRGPDANHEFNRAWLAACQCVLKPNGTIWVSGTSQLIHAVEFALEQLSFDYMRDVDMLERKSDYAHHRGFGVHGAGPPLGP